MHFKCNVFVCFCQWYVFIYARYNTPMHILLRKRVAVIGLGALFITVVVVGTVFVTRSKQQLVAQASRPAPIDPQRLSGDYQQEEIQGIFNNEPVLVPTQIPMHDRQRTPPSLHVLGEQDVLKLIFIDLTNQRLYAYEGRHKVFDFTISSGKWGATPVGRFEIWIKLRYTRMTGGSEALGTYYDLPNVPYTMYFANDQYGPEDGYALHGAYWHDKFGQPMSHGCINMNEQDAEKLYYWAHPFLGEEESVEAGQDNPGTEVIIYGEAPGA